MKNTSSKRSKQRGAAAAELAVILPVLLRWIFVPLSIGRSFWHYTAAQKAAQDSARYLSTISVQELREDELAEQAAAVAKNIALAGIQEHNPGTREPEIIMCGDDPCTGTGALPVPENVRVTVRMRYFDMLGLIDAGRYGITINAVSVVNYAGN